MIQLTRLNSQTFALNTDLIERIEETPDTVLTLIDGTRYGSFTIPMDASGAVDETQGGDPSRCVVPFDEYPHAFTPEQGYLLTGNNDPAGITFDGNFWNEPYHIGGPWNEAYRGNRIDELLAEAVSSGATLDDMERIQGDHQSQVGRYMAPLMLAAVERVRSADVADLTDAEARALAAVARELRGAAAPQRVEDARGVARRGGLGRPRAQAARGGGGAQRARRGAQQPSTRHPLHRPRTPHAHPTQRRRPPPNVLPTATGTMWASCSPSSARRTTTSTA